MKKITLFLLLVAFAGMANAANYYVDPAKADDNGAGTSWQYAKKTIAAAYTAAIAAGNWNNILVKGGIIDFTSTQTMGVTANFYGSCAGDESSYTQRPLTDNDGNGIVEPWEFQYPTTLRFTSVNSDALKLPSGSGIVFDGFTITHTGTSSSGTFKTLTLQTATCQFKNNTIKDCDVTVKMTTSIYGVLIKAVGNFTNNLIENNKVTVNATADGTCAPTMEVAAGARVAQCLIRNNRVTMDYSSGTSANGAARGLIVFVTPSSTSPYTSVASCLIHNNEMTFTGNASNMSMNNGTTVALQSTTAANTIYRDSLINCTIAYNKGTTTSTAFGNAGVKIFYNGTGLTDGTGHFVLNNVVLNNQTAAGAINNINTNGTIYNGSLTNNYTNGVGLSTTASEVNSNNNNSVDASTNSPNFISPTSSAGYLAYNTMKTSNWRLGSGSYLIAKGVTTSTLKDKAGNSFAGTPSVGAYEDAKMSQSISFPVFATKTYGNADFIPGATSNTSSVVPITYTSSIGAVATIVAGQIHLTGAGQTTITASQASNTNYNAASNVQKVLTVSPATLTVSNATAQNKVYDGTDAATLTGTLSGILNSDAVTLIGTGTFASVNVGNGIAVTSTSTLGGAKAGGYTLTQPTGLTANITAATSSPTGDNLNNSGLTDQQLANTNLTISSGEFIINATKTVQSLTIAPSAKLTFSSGTLTVTNGITLESTSDGTATLVDAYETPTVNATVKQYVTAGRNWYMSAPLNNTANVSDLNKGNSVQYYEESTGLWKIASGTLTRGRGYIQVANSTQGTTGTVQFEGIVNSGDVPVSLTNNTAGRGFNLVGNPYPSYLNWSLVATDLVNTHPTTGAKMPNGTAWYRTIDYNGKSAWATGVVYAANAVVYNGASFYKTLTGGTSGAIAPTGTGTNISDGSVIWQNEGSVYIFATVSSNGTPSHASGSNLIPPMQAFWVKTNTGGGTLTFKNSMRAHESVSNKLKAPKSQLSTMPFVRLSVSNGASADQVAIYASDNASNAFDSADAPKFFNNSGSYQAEIYTLAGNEKLAINALNNIEEGTTLALGFVTEKDNRFSLKATEIANLPANLQLILRDKQTNTEFNLSEGEAYQFGSSATNNADRFSLIFRAKGTTTGFDNKNQSKAIVYTNAAGQIVISAPEKNNYAIYNAMGQLIENGVLNTERETRNTKHLAEGVYVVKVNNQSTRVIIK